MIVDPEQVNFFRSIAQREFALKVLDDLGPDSLEHLLVLTESVSEIYKHLLYESFEEVLICKSLNSTPIFEFMDSSKVIEVTSLNSFSNRRGNQICIEIVNRNKFRICIDAKINKNELIKDAILYQHLSYSEEETIYTTNSTSTLRQIPGSDSYFALQSFKELDKALEQYAIKRARNSNCPILKNAWFSKSRIFFKVKPESLLRDSLTDFLKISFREEVRPEQIVDDSHPVDIKVTWQMINRIALIEIKWLGKSLKNLGEEFTSIYTDARAREGAKQLSDYLDENIIQAPDKNSKGYLVIFDARRWQTNNQTKDISEENGLYYINSEINYNPKYEIIRKDFAKPIRFFINPIIKLN
ncbi:hypothetical protein RM553_07075 [Zunongwangia sp. F363]|uniref:Uncharacterized protein n=1 Tax=Autumnicola tepida TaxID=3075595 RepID=A0ABU3C8D0_9FLAO|nr:hypothetical protein [Zunongwangia sp. F363]MDT0642594.1 hypothetical protein [Zunongwangia sp. F363]